MADIVGSLFGLSVPELEAQQKQKQLEENQQYAMLMAKASPAPGRTYNQMLLGRSLGQALGRGLFGVQDPMIERATKLEGILKNTQDELGTDATDPTKLYKTLSQKLGEAGFSRESVQALQLGKDAEIAYMKAQADLAKAKKEGDTRVEYQKLLDDLKVATDTGDTQRANDLRARISVLGTEGKPANSTDALAAESFRVMNDPNASPVDKAKAQKQINDIYQFKNVPAGFERDAISGVVRPSPGGPADILQQKENTKRVGYLKNRLDSISSVENAFAKAEKLIGPKTTGLASLALARIPGEPAYDLSTELNTITANLAFDKLQDMRNNSPTGGALGNVSNLELESLKSAVANLKQAQSEQQLRDNLTTVMNMYKRIKEAAQYDLDTFKATTPSPTAPKPSGKFIPGKTYEDANGNKAIYQQDGTWKDVQ